MEDLQNIIKELIEVRKNLKLTKLSDDIILDCSTRIFISQNIQREKEQHQQGQYPKKEFTGQLKNPNEPATSKQIYLLKKLGFTEDTSKITKIEASQLIKEAKEKQEGDAW